MARILLLPSLAAVPGHIDGQLETAPYAQLVEGVAEIVFYDLFRGANGAGNFAVGLPSQTRPATCNSFAVSRSRGCMFHLLLLKHRGRQLHPFSAVPDTRPQEKRPQVLLNGARADVQLRRDLFVAATLDQ